MPRYERTQQPASAPADYSGNGLVYASAVPYEGVQRYGTWGCPVPATANGVTFGKTGVLGKAFVASSTTPNPIRVSAFPVVAPPFTVMVLFNQTTQAAQGTLLAFGGSGVGGGWALAADSQPVMTFGGVANYFPVFPNALVAGRDYVLVVMVANSTVQCWVRDLINGTMQVSTSIAVGTMLNTTLGLTFGADTVDGVTYADPFNGPIGASAIWSRALSQSEIYALLADPYQLWLVRAASPPASSVNGGNLLWTEANDATAIVATAQAIAAVAWTEDGDAAAAAGTVQDIAALAWTEANDVAALVGAMTASVAIAWAEANDTAALAGAVTAGVAASLATVLSGASAQITAAETVSSTVSSTLGLSATLAAQELMNGPLATTLANAAAAILAKTTNSGTLNATLGLTGSMIAQELMLGPLSVTLAGAQAALAVVVGLPVTGALSTTLDGATPVIYVMSGDTIAGESDALRKRRGRR